MPPHRLAKGTRHPAAALLATIIITVQSRIVNYFHNRILGNYSTFPSPLTFCTIRIVLEILVPFNYNHGLQIIFTIFWVQGKLYFLQCGCRDTFGPVTLRFLPCFPHGRRPPALVVLRTPRGGGGEASEWRVAGAESDCTSRAGQRS